MIKSIQSVIGFLFLWQIGSIAGMLDPEIFPAPSSILGNISWNYQILTYHSLYTLGRLLLGIILAIILAVPTAFLIARFSLMGALLKPLLATFYPIPKIVIYPFLMIVFGTGDTSKIILIAIGAFFLILTQVLSGLERILHSSLKDVIRVYKISGLKLYYHILLKGIKIDFLTGLNLAIGYGLVMAVAGEMSAASNGIGFYIWNAWDGYQITNMYSGLMVISFLGFLSHFFIERIKAPLIKKTIL